MEQNHSSSTTVSEGRRLAPEGGARPLVIIAGPTATGKSAAAVAVARALNGAVISADSMQVYHDMPIGSARITQEEMQGVPHYLVDIIDPTQEWNVVRFQQEAKRALTEIYAQGKLPILCGGTGFYIQALLYDIAFTKAKEDPAYRQELQKAAARNGTAWLHDQLKAVDPAAAGDIPAGNEKRVIRALEYYHVTGERISDHNRQQHAAQPAYDACYFVLTMEREKLYGRIDQRVDKMMQEGLLGEVRSLAGRGLTAKDVSMQGLGYRQLLAFLDGSCTLEEAVSRIKIETRHFAKRQLTWFRREEKRFPGLTWVNVDQFASRQALHQFLVNRIRCHYGSTGTGNPEEQGKSSS